MNNTLIEHYLSLLKKSLLNELYLENEARIAYFVYHAFTQSIPAIPQLIPDFLSIRQSADYKELARAREGGDFTCLSGRDAAGNFYPLPEAMNLIFTAHTMIGRKRLDHLHQCLDLIRTDNIPGDLIETGVWKGGATIFMNGYLYAHGMRDRLVWAADSYEGLPKPRLPQDAGSDHSKEKSPYLCISQEEVEELFTRYDLLNGQVKFLKGWFCDTLPNAPIQQLALLRLDGDLYESTMDALNNLYPKLSVGGFLIVDDYVPFPQCKKAIMEYRENHGIRDPLIQVDGHSVYWRRSR